MSSFQSGVLGGKQQTYWPLSFPYHHLVSLKENSVHLVGQTLVIKKNYVENQLLILIWAILISFRIILNISLFIRKEDVQYKMINRLRGCNEATSGCWKCKINMPVWLLSGESSLPGFLQSFLLFSPHMVERERGRALSLVCFFFIESLF